MTIFYGPKEDPGVKELGQESPGASTRVGGAPTPPTGAWACLVDAFSSLWVRHSILIISTFGNCYDDSLHLGIITAV